MDFGKENIHLIPNWLRSNPGKSQGWCEPPDGVQKWNSESFSYLKVVNIWKSPKNKWIIFSKDTMKDYRSEEKFFYFRNNKLYLFFNK